jgi:hypothetical protein
MSGIASFIFNLQQASAEPLIVDVVDAEKAAVNPRRQELEECVRRQAHHHDEDQRRRDSSSDTTAIQVELI